MNHLTKFLLVLMWLIGVVVAKGFWPTLASLIFPFVAWYFAVKHFMIYFGVL